MSGSLFLRHSVYAVSVWSACFYRAMLRRARLCHSLSSVCLSVRPSVTFRYRHHIGCNSSKLISQPNIFCHCLTNKVVYNSLRPICGLTPTYAIWYNGNTLKLGWNRGGVTQEHKKPAISPQRCKMGPMLLWRTNRKSHTRFRLVAKSMTLNGVFRDCPKFF